MVKLLKAEVEKSLSILMKRTFDGGPRAAKLLAYEFKKQQNEVTIVKLNGKSPNLIINDRKGIANHFAAYYQDLYDSTENPVNKENLKQFFQKIHLPKVTQEQNLSK